MNYLKRSTDILLITDSVSDANAIQSMIEKLPSQGITLSQQYNLSSGLNALNLNKADVVILDLPLPGEHPFSSIDALRAAHPKIPLIALLKDQYDALLNDAKKHGVDVVVSKSALNASWFNYMLASAIDYRELKNTLLETQKSAKMASWQINPANNEWSSEGQLQEIFGKSLERLEDYLYAVHPDDQREVALAFMQSFKEGLGFDISHRIIHPQAGEQQIQLKGFADKNKANQVIHLWGTIQLVQQTASKESSSNDPQEALASPVYSNGHTSTGTPHTNTNASKSLVNEPVVLEKVTDINYLKEVAGGDTSIMKKAISKFIESTPGTLEKMRQYLNEKDYYQLAKCAHKLKSSVALMGMDEALQMVKFIEVAAKDQKGVEDLPGLVNQTNKIINLSFLELEETLTALKD